MNNFDVVVVFCTAPNEATARNISSKVLTQQLAACVTIHSGFSLYYWEGKLEQRHEIQMMLKTDIARQKALFAYLKYYHPYKIPELLALPVIDIDKDYLLWLKNF